MKITDNFKKIKFYTLGHGDAFRAIDKDDSMQIFMKVVSHDGCNAIKMSNGELYYFGPDDTVSPVDCELIVK